MRQPLGRTSVRFMPAKRLLMAAATAFFAINLWTGAPLLALWVGSQVVGQQALSMGAVFVVIIVLAIVVSAIVFALGRLDSGYKALTGQPLRENRLTWLRSMNTQDEAGNAIPLSLLEAIIMATVYVTVLLLLVWFFVFAGSPLPS
jgi:hypothetical protein